MDIKIIETRTANIWLEDDGIIRLMGKPNSDISLTDLKENLTICEEVSKGIRRPLFVSMSKIKSMDRSSRITAQEDSVRFVTAVALFVDTNVGKVLGNFFLGMYKPPYPLKMFTAETDATDWLKRYLP